MLITDPGAAATVRDKSPISVAPRSGTTGTPLAPMQPAAFINPAVIHRSTALGAIRRCATGEGVRVPGPAPLAWAGAGAISGSQAAIAGAPRRRPACVSAWRARMSSVFPSSGFGPAADRARGLGLEHGRDRPHDPRGKETVVEIDGAGHPGYLATAKMMGEAGLLLAEPGATPDRTGCADPRGRDRHAGDRSLPARPARLHLLP